MTIIELPMHRRKLMILDWRITMVINWMRFSKNSQVGMMVTIWCML